MNSGKLYLIPTVLSEEALHIIPAYVHETTRHLNIFFVEDEKTARRYLRKTGYTISFDEVTMLPLNEHTHQNEFSGYIKYLIDGNDCGLMSEGGVPAVADPGAGLIRMAHQNNIQIVPLAGSSSIILALMASGLNGQQFCFHGYLPIKQPERNKKILQIEQRIKTGETQIMIETPYRNQMMIHDILHCCHPSTLFCIAGDLTGKNELIQTRTIEEWSKIKPQLEKIPAIFLLGS